MIMISSFVLAQAVLIAQERPSLSDMKTWWQVSKAPKWEDYKGKVVIFHTYPSFCCGWHESMVAVKKELERHPKDVRAISFVYGFMATREAFNEEAKNLKISWPIGVDADESFAKKFFPNDMPRYTFTLFDRKGKRLDVVVSSFDQLGKEVDKILAAN